MIPAIGNLKQEDQKFNVIFGYKMTLSQPWLQETHLKNKTERLLTDLAGDLGSVPVLAHSYL